MNALDKAFESEKNRKALLYTIIVCAGLLMLFFIIKWKNVPPTLPIVQDLIEINLGNNEEGWGQEQPLIKGEMKPTPEEPVASQQTAAPLTQEEEKVQPDENAEPDAAPVNKTIKTPTKPKTQTSVVPTPAPAPKPQKPKITYNGPGNGKGNNATEDNGYRYQGNNPNGKGDAGDPSGDKDSYGNTPGGKKGGPKIISGNRKIIRYYSFTGNLPKASIMANIKVSPSGTGSFMGFAKGSTSRSQEYATAISNYLRNMQFDKSGEESIVVVQFNFNYQ
ncbi:MAG TPA: hypothetical protein PKC62_10300 [Ferruginibacter sp.]|nr:hypothetical protein [Bacteroidota bacterium]MCC6693966.1 hypothetical protein [Chitinophagaceae bacterium]HMT97068.1 hypothetical protein [Ferruginibacter sp.]HMU24413.1 hypothetical protein [Ferruginibacter sp.]